MTTIQDVLYYKYTTKTHTFELEMMVNRDIVLFDMDGTLTEARQPFASFLSSPCGAWGMSLILVSLLVLT